MTPIVAKRELAPGIYEFHLYAPLIARKRRPGQFVVLRLHEKGERFPLTIVDSDPNQGTLRLIVQVAGKSTRQMAEMEVGEGILDVVGPLGTPTPIERVGSVACVGGGIGVACVYPIAVACKEAGNRLISIIGARTASLLLMEEELASLSDELYLSTDDGSRGEKGFVSDVLRRLLEEGKPIHRVYAVGPARMMQAVSEVTRPYGIKTIVSLNPIMVDATGMCGGCRVTVEGQTVFACVDGPDFDGHKVDFEELIQRQAMYREWEEEALRRHLQEQGCAQERLERTREVRHA